MKKSIRKLVVIVITLVLMLQLTPVMAPPTPARASEGNIVPDTTYSGTAYTDTHIAYEDGDSVYATYSLSLPHAAIVKTKVKMNASTADYPYLYLYAYRPDGGVFSHTDFDGYDTCESELYLIAGNYKVEFRASRGSNASNTIDFDFSMHCKYYEESGGETIENDNNSVENASTISPNGSYLSFMTKGIINEQPDGRDYYKLVIPKDGILYFKAKSFLDEYDKRNDSYFGNQNSVELRSGEDDISILPQRGKHSKYFVVKKGTYYLRVDSLGKGPFYFDLVYDKLPQVQVKKCKTVTFKRLRLSYNSGYDKIKFNKLVLNPDSRFSMAEINWLDDVKVEYQLSKNKSFKGEKTSIFKLKDDIDFIQTEFKKKTNDLCLEHNWYKGKWYIRFRSVGTMGRQGTFNPDVTLTSPWGKAKRIKLK